MKTIFSMKIFSVWPWAVAFTLIFAALAEASPAQNSVYHLFAKRVEIRFRLIDLEDYDKIQFRESLKHQTPLFTRLAWIEDRKVLEIVYAKEWEDSKRKGLVVEVNLPKGSWKSDLFKNQNVGEIITSLLASVKKVFRKTLS